MTVPAAPKKDSDVLMALISETVAGSLYARARQGLAPFSESASGHGIVDGREDRACDNAGGEAEEDTFEPGQR